MVAFLGGASMSSVNALGGTMGGGRPRRSLAASRAARSCGVRKSVPNGAAFIGGLTTGASAARLGKLNSAIKNAINIWLETPVFKASLGHCFTLFDVEKFILLRLS